MTGPRDWDRELADIDRLIEKMPARAPGDPPAPAGAPRSPGAPATRPGAMLPEPSSGAARRAARGQVIGTWVLLLLVAALGAFLPVWPYVNDCGTGLMGYLGAVGAVVLGALWAAVLTWRHRRPVGHVLAVATLLWGLGLAAERVLPRIGYAAESAEWICRAPAPPPQQPSPVAP